MKKLEVPLRLQSENSQDCGPVCVQIVLEYFGIQTSLESLISKLTYVESGTSAYDNGSLLLSVGLKVKAITAQPLLFSPNTIHSFKGKDDYIQAAAKRSSKVPADKPILDTLVTYLEQGGEMQLQIPSFEHIKEAIDAGNLIIALLYGNALGSNEGGFHFCVVNGYDEEKVFITNPLPTSKRQDWFPVADFLFAVHSSTTKDVDNGTLLVISK